MKAEDLRAIQAPLKERYREEPNAARITLKAQGRVGEGVTCKVQTGRALVEAGLHPLTGGDGLSLCSGDMLLEALVACAGVTLSSMHETAARLTREIDGHSIGTAQQNPDALARRRPVSTRHECRKSGRPARLRNNTQ